MNRFFFFLETNRCKFADHNRNGLLKLATNSRRHHPVNDDYTQGKKVVKSTTQLNSTNQGKHNNKTRHAWSCLHVKKKENQEKKEKERKVTLP